MLTAFNQTGTPNASQSFSDVAPDRWSFEYVEGCRNFLTGYSNPFGGLPAFHPTEYATREDIAVALVKLLGFSDTDANDKDYAARKFTDGSSISPSLLPYVSVACEKGFISGYPDGTFGASKGITRAETIVLLNRVTKQAMSDIDAELELSASISYSNYGQTAKISIVAEGGTSVTVNGETVKMTSNYSDEYIGSYVYEFPSEGSKSFTITGTKAGKTRTINLTAQYQVGEPELTITSCPSSVSDKTVTISGTMYDENYTTELLINGISVATNSSVDYKKSWSQTYTLKEGDNTFDFELINSAGKSTKQTKTIKFSAGDPEILFINCPASTTKENITIKGKITGTNDDAMLFIDDEEVRVSSSGEFSVTYTLNEGDNTFVFRAVNGYGKEVTVTKTITYAPKTSEVIEDTESEVTIEGKITKDIEASN